MTAAIIIPAYNAAAWLAEAIGSALAQTHPAAQVIVVDDGSTDGTVAVAEKFADAVMLLRQPNAGVAAARNFGAAQTSADWLLFLDADDRLRPDALARLLSRANETTLGAIYGKSVFFSGANPPGREHGGSEMEGSMPVAARVAFWKAPIATPGVVLIRREVFENVGGWNVRFNTTADRDLWCRIGAGSEFGFVNDIVAERRIHDTNMSGDKNRARRQALEVQLAFLEWCAQRGIGTGFLQTSVTGIFERNAARAIEERAFLAADWIASEAQRLGISSAVLDRARRLVAMPDLARELELRIGSFWARRHSSSSPEDRR